MIRRNLLIGTALVAACIGIGCAMQIVTASEVTATPAEGQPGTRCTRLTYPKTSKRVKPQGNERCARLYAKHKGPKFLPNQPPNVSLSASAAINGKSTVSAPATDPDGDTLLYTYSTTGGRILGEGPTASWDFTGASAGTYTLTVEVDDGCGCVSFSSTNVTVQ